MKARSMGVVAAAAMLAAPATAGAFCGFYVSGAGADLFNNATMVVMMRDGTRTVLSMQNNYQGPPSDFAMVVPVPVVLQKENVKTLPREVFGRVDKLAAPRLVEYWETDPCYIEPPMELDRAAAEGGAVPTDVPKGSGVKIEAQFQVGEYDVVILSAKEATGLDRWLRDNKYKIPEGAEPYLKPYVEQGSKFFVARVDVEKVTFKDGQAMLSPLRFHYETNKFDLPIRLGMMNSAGTQDLIVHILARTDRYQVANYGNVTIPTNIDVKESARDRFGEFYAALFDRTIEKNKGAVVTEYAWDASSCDPCPEPPLEPNELATLGADVVGGDPYGFVLTRLHARYSKDGISQDLVFEKAKPIVGGREHIIDAARGTLEEGAREDSYNNFQGRYAIRHEWKKPIACANPIRGRWGGPPDGGTATMPKPATDLAFVARGKVQLAQIVRKDVPEIGVKAEGGGEQAAAPEAKPEEKEPTAAGGDKPATEPAAQPDEGKKKGGCGCQTSAGGGAAGMLAVIVAIAIAARRRRRGSAGPRVRG